MNLSEKVSKVREQFERKHIDVNLLKKLYSEYVSVEDVDSFITTALNQFPKLNCGLTTVYLHYVLGGKIINGKFAENNHTFLLVNKQVVDITADQYCGPKVYVGKLKMPWNLRVQSDGPLLGNKI